jgi:hypothetical protein
MDSARLLPTFKQGVEFTPSGTKSGHQLLLCRHSYPVSRLFSSVALIDFASA